MFKELNSAIRFGWLTCALIVLSALAWHGASQAEDVLPRKKRSLTQKQTAEIVAHQKAVAERKTPSRQASPSRPFSELEEAGYLFVNSGFDFDSEQAKLEMARNLPSDVVLVVFTDSNSSVEEIKKFYAPVLPPERLKVAKLRNARKGFWARDGLPVPAWTESQSLALVDAHYYYPFEPDQTLASMFRAPLIKTDYYFEGGNFVTNDKGACLTVDNQRSSEIPDSVFFESYGCKQLVRLPFEKGIGHADESVKFIDSKTVLTDSVKYAEILQSKGFGTRLLPRPDGEYETYVNSLLINGTMYIPVFNEARDAEAVDVYRQAGFKVVPIPTVELSNEGEGSLHCITMTYPKVPFSTMRNLLPSLKFY